MIPHSYEHYIWDKVFKRGLSKFCGRQPLKNLKGYGLLKHFNTWQILSWILCLIYSADMSAESNSLWLVFGSRSGFA